MSSKSLKSNKYLDDIHKEISELFDGRINFKMPSKKLIPCVFYQQNKCTYGQQCKFKHWCHVM